MIFLKLFYKVKGFFTNGLFGYLAFIVLINRFSGFFFNEKN